MPEICVDLSATMTSSKADAGSYGGRGISSGGSLSATAAARGLRARRQEGVNQHTQHQVLEPEQGSLPANFTSPVTAKQVGRSTSQKKAEQPLPPPKPRPPTKPKPKGGAKTHPAPVAAGKPAISKKPTAGVPSKRPLLAAFQRPVSTSVDSATKPKVKAAFGRTGSSDKSGGDKQQPASDCPKKVTAPSVGTVPPLTRRNTLPSPLSPVQPQASPTVSRCLYDTGTDSGSPRQLVRQCAENSPEPAAVQVEEVLSPAPASPDGRDGGCSPGLLSRRRAIRGKKGVSLPRPMSASPNTSMFKYQQSPSPAVSVSSPTVYEPISWSFDAPGVDSPLNSSGNSGSLGCDLSSANCRPVISERLSSLAPGSTPNSRSNSPERYSMIKSDSLDSADGDKMPPVTSPATRRKQLHVEMPHNNSRSYEPSPTAASPAYFPSGSSSIQRLSLSEEEQKLEKELETVKTRAQTLALRTDNPKYPAIGSPIVASSRKAFNQAYVKFAGGSCNTSAPDVSTMGHGKMAHSVSSSAIYEPSPSTASMNGLRRSSQDVLSATAESKEKVRHLVELYGGAGGVRKPAVPTPRVTRGGSLPTKASSPSSSTATLPTANTRPEPAVTSESHSKPEQAPPPKKANIPRRISLRKIAAKVSPVIYRKSDKKRSIKDSSTSTSDLAAAKTDSKQDASKSPSLSTATQTNGLSNGEDRAKWHPSSISIPVSGTSDHALGVHNTRTAGRENQRSHSESAYPEQPPTPSSPGATARASRQNRYNSVKSLILNSPGALATSPPTSFEEVPLMAPGSSTTPVPCTPSPDLECSQESAVSGSSGTPCSSTALSPTDQHAENGIGGLPSETTTTTTTTTGLSDTPHEVYDEVEFVEGRGKQGLAPSDSGYSTNPESLANALSASLLSAVSVSHVTSQQPTIIAETLDPEYEDVPIEEFNTDDDNVSTDQLEDSPYEDVLIVSSNRLAPKPTQQEKRNAYGVSISLNPAAEGQRLLWQEMDMVKSSGRLEHMSRSEIKLQEAMFEVLSSEESYNKSLHVVTEHFMPVMPVLVKASPGGGSSSSTVHTDGNKIFVEKSAHHRLFSNLTSLVTISDNFVQELRDRLVAEVEVSTIADIVLKHVTKHFQPYVTYCTNQTYQLQEAKKLGENAAVKKVLMKFEDVNGQKLPFATYLLQPMQRITRLPLLIVTMLDYLPPDSEHLVLSQQALQEVQLFVSQCNEGARSMERMEELINLQEKIKFDPKIRRVMLVSQKRFLKRSGHLVQIGGSSGKKLLKNMEKNKVSLFLFNDMVIIAKQKKKPEECYQVIDYTSLPMAMVEECPVSQLPHKVLEVERRRASSLLNVTTDGREGKDSGESSPVRSATPSGDDVVSTAFKLVFLENWDEKPKEYHLLADSLTEKMRWKSAFGDQEERNEADGKKSVVYELWNCPQHIALFNYVPQQADELALQAGDIVKVLRKMEDDWCHGERLPDGTRGWFPIQFTEEIKSEDQRGENLRQRRLLLAEQRQKLDSSVDERHRVM